MMCNLETQHVSHFFAFAYSITTFWVEYLMVEFCLCIVKGYVKQRSGALRCLAWPWESGSV